MSFVIPHDRRAGCYPSVGRVLLRGWIVCALAAFSLAPAASRAASARTPNFIVTAPTQAFAEQVGQAAEKYRQELAVLWLEKELPNWAQPCPIVLQVSPTIGAGGATSFVFDRGEVFDWHMTIQGSEERILDSVLPHEITHTIFASHFRRPLPRWADEGACTTVEHASERRKQQQLLVQFLQTKRGIAFNQMFVMRDYPQDVMPLYAQGFSLARFLIEQGGRQKFLAYLAEGLRTEAWPATTQKFYGFANLGALQTTWVAWVSRGSPAIATAAPPADDHRSTAAAVQLVANMPAEPNCGSKNVWVNPEEGWRPPAGTGAPATTATRPASTSPAAGRDGLWFFSSTSCAPCARVKPLIDRLEQAGYPITRIDCERQRQLANQFRVEQWPSFLIVKAGVEVDRLRAGGEARLVELIEFLHRHGFGGQEGLPPQEPAHADTAHSTPPATSRPAPAARSDDGPLVARMDELERKISCLTRMPGPAGPQGAPGPAGEPGPPGNPGTDGRPAPVDYDCLAERVAQRLPATRVVFLGRDGKQFDGPQFHVGGTLALPPLPVQVIGRDGRTVLDSETLPLDGRHHLNLTHFPREVRGSE